VHAPASQLWPTCTPLSERTPAYPKAGLVYTDGSQLKPGGVTGCGIYYADGQQEDRSFTYTGGEHTVLRAELAAIWQALACTPPHLRSQRLSIATDSLSSIQRVHCLDRDTRRGLYALMF
jgi:ribonuclease HI